MKQRQRTENAAKSTGERWVITGGPGVGKTTLCHELARQGYQIVPEAARAIISEEQTKGSKQILPWTNLSAFQELVYKRTIHYEHQINYTRHAKENTRPIFFDRGVLDGIAYCIEGAIKVPDCLKKEFWNKRYTGVFILEPLQTFTNDNQRVENHSRARHLHELIIQVYEQAGYQPIHIPDTTLEDRLTLIKEYARCNNGRML